MNASLRSLGSSLALLFLLAGGAHAQSLTITTLAGSTTGGGWIDAQGTAARFSDPAGIALEASGSLLIADTGNHVIRRLTPAGVVTTVAGTPGVAGHADGIGSGVRFDSPRGVAVDSGGVIYVADTDNMSSAASPRTGRSRRWRGSRAPRAGQTAPAPPRRSAPRTASTSTAPTT